MDSVHLITYEILREHTPRHTNFVESTKKISVRSLPLDYMSRMI